LFYIYLNLICLEVKLINSNNNFFVKHLFHLSIYLSGKWSGHKGKSRRFTNPDELEEERKRDEKERAWRVNLLI